MNLSIRILLSTVLFANSAFGATTGVLAKIGGDYEARGLDLARCRDVAASARADELPGQESIPMASGAEGGLYGVAGATIANLLIATIQTDRARSRAAAFCMSNLGYVVAPLTAEEDAAVGALQGDRRDAFERILLSGDLGPRLTRLLMPKVPPLPGYTNAVGVHGGLRLDFASLKAAEQPMTVGAIVMTGRLERWRTAVLETPFRSSTGPIMVSAESGTVFHQVDYRTQRAPLLRTNGATWCGQMQQTSAVPSGMVGAGGAAEVYCLTSHVDAYDLFRPSGFSWLAGPYRSGFVLPRLTQPVVLRERDKDDLGPIDFEIRVTEVKPGRVMLEGKARRDGRSVDLWSRRLDFDASGQAILPLWSHRLVLVRSGGKAVTAIIDQRGNGQGWREGG